VIGSVRNIPVPSTTIVESPGWPLDDEEEVYEPSYNILIISVLFQSIPGAHRCQPSHVANRFKGSFLLVTLCCCLEFCINFLHWGAECHVLRVDRMVCRPPAAPEKETLNEPMDSKILLQMPNFWNLYR
jgi:hypothetical protein